MPADLSNSAYLQTCRDGMPSHMPVWFQRQAGRSLPEYRAIRGEGTITHAIKDPERATEITLQPVRRYGVDAAILFSDIITPVNAVGFGIDIEPGVGPVAERPLRTSDDLARLRPLDPERDTPYVIETVRNLAGELSIPLIGFAGAPFTVASYLIEGGPSKNKEHTKAMMLDAPEQFAEVMNRLADIAIASLVSQVEAGASAIQLFDSWAGCLSPDLYERHVLPASGRIFDALGAYDVPRAHFGINTGELLPLMHAAGADVVGVDWLVPVDRARERLGDTVVLQGNLDPVVCLAGWPAVEAAVRDILRRVSPGRHVFNLGHGVLPATDPEILERVVDLVHREGFMHAEGPSLP